VGGSLFLGLGVSWGSEVGAASVGRSGCPGAWIMSAWIRPASGIGGVASGGFGLALVAAYDSYRYVVIECGSSGVAIGDVVGIAATAGVSGGAVACISWSIAIAILVPSGIPCVARASIRGGTSIARHFGCVRLIFGVLVCVLLLEDSVLWMLFSCRRLSN
jgi:hypothetical protein